MNPLKRIYYDKPYRDRSFWVIHIVGCAAIFICGIKTASKVAAPIALCQVMRRILAK